jgi:hypothetical protein
MVKKIWDDFEDFAVALKIAERGFWLIIMVVTLSLGVWWVWL